MLLKCKSGQIIWNNLSLVSSDNESRIELYIMCWIECVQLSWSLSLSCTLNLFLFFLSSFCSCKKHVWQLDFFSWSASVPVPCNWTLLQRRSSPKHHMEIIDYRQNKGYKPHQECMSPLSSVFFFLSWSSCSLRNPPSLHLLAVWARFNISYEFKRLEELRKKTFQGKADEHVIQRVLPAGPNRKVWSM